MLRGRSQFFRRPREHSIAHRSNTAGDLSATSITTIRFNQINHLPNLPSTHNHQQTSAIPLPLPTTTATITISSHAPQPSLPPPREHTSAPTASCTTPPPSVFLPATTATTTATSPQTSLPTPIPAPTHRRNTPRNRPQQSTFNTTAEHPQQTAINITTTTPAEPPVMATTTTANTTHQQQPLNKNNNPSTRDPDAGRPHHRPQPLAIVRHHPLDLHQSSIQPAKHPRVHTPKVQSQSYPRLAPRRPPPTTASPTCRDDPCYRPAHATLPMSPTPTADPQRHNLPRITETNRMAPAPADSSSPIRDVFKWGRRRKDTCRENVPNTGAPHPGGALRGSSRKIGLRSNAPGQGSSFFTFNDKTKALVPFRYSNADVHIAGWLSKRGKRLGSRVDRFLELRGSLLSNARQQGARPTWTVNVRGCKVLSGPNREIIFKANNNFSSFYAPDDIVHAKWIEALQSVSATVTDFYDFGKLIGRGAYSEVFLARDQLRSELCAIKVLDPVNREHARLIERELQVLRLLNNKHLVRTYDIFDTPQKTYVVMEYLAGGELLDMITDNDHLSERNAKHVLRQVLEAVLYLHDRGIVHRDIKPENILCTGRSFPLRVKLTDFGLSKIVTSPDGKSPDTTMRSQCGTAYYLAPEIVNNVSYGKPVDMWACGVVGYVMLAGKFPFYGDSDEKFMRRLRAGVNFPSKEWRSISTGAKSLIRGLLDPNPETRLTAEQALEHRWLNDFTDAVASSSKLSSAVGDARQRETLKYSAHNESLSLQLCNFASTKTDRRTAETADGVGEEDEDLVLRTDEMGHAGSAHEYYAKSRVLHEFPGSDDESILPLPRIHPDTAHVDAPLPTVSTRAAGI